jgi:hypothetical protein
MKRKFENVLEEDLNSLHPHKRVDRSVTSTARKNQISTELESEYIPGDTTSTYPLDTSIELFEYAPLDHNKSSIRLIQVLPDLCDGFIQCRVRHSHIEDEYTCLSYEWGLDEQIISVLMDGKHTYVRQNLWDFLSIAARKPNWHRKWFWIDALCIDQSNLKERNHQVQQMGSVYSRATEVVAWFGMDSQIESYLRTPENRTLKNEMSFTSVFKAFRDASYFSRAWITQELVLARSIVLAAGSFELDTLELPVSLFKKVHDYLHLSGFQILSPKRVELRGQDLIDLLRMHTTKQSREARDRVYSLLALCDSVHGLVVDYDLSDQEVAAQVLTACHSSFCLCTVDMIRSVLDLSASNDDPFVVIKYQRSSMLEKTYSRSYVLALRMHNSSNIHRSRLDLRNSDIVLTFTCWGRTKVLNLTNRLCVIERNSDGSACDVRIPLSFLLDMVE